jgi:putative transposase
MRHRLFIHLIWTTRFRAPQIDDRVAAYLATNLPIIARQERARVLELGIVRTHLHMLVRMHPTTDLPRMTQRMKGGTAMALNRIYPRLELFWAKGYDVETINSRILATVQAYVRNQHHHHPNDAIRGWPPDSAAHQPNGINRAPHAITSSDPNALP